MTPVTGLANPVELLLLGQVGGQRCGVDRRAGEVSYADMLGMVTEYAGRLSAAGVRPGCRAVVLSDDSVAAITAVLALWWYGCVPILLHPMLRDAEIGFVLRDSEAEFAELNVAPERRARLRDALAGTLDADSLAAGRTGLRTGLVTELCPARASQAAGPPAGFRDTDELLVQYTSGSTGRPRGVRHCMMAIHAVLRGVGSLLALRPDDVVLSTAKLSFGYGFGNSLLFPFAAGSSSVLLDGPADPFSIAAALQEYRPTVLFSVPRLYAGMLKLADQGKLVDTSSLRLAVTTGEQLPADLATRITETFNVPLINGFGATEVLHTVVAAAVGQGKATEPGSIGFPVPGVTAAIRDDVGQPAADGIPGALHITTASAGLGYVNRPADAARTFADGGVYTGDIALRAPTGEICHVGRADDMLLIGGYKVAPAEIERVLRTIPAVADCAVVGTADASGLEQATAYVVVRDPGRQDEARTAVRTALRASLAPYKRPSRIEIIDALPTTANGKLARFRLRGPVGTPEETT
jgi:acyl-coenzyme A synthetase/AMP-(fatty) acid ligase